MDYVIGLEEIYVLFVHKYSGGIVLDSVIQISLAYFLSTASLIYAQHLTKGLAEPEIDLKYTGVVLFLIGIIGNFYHHYILSQLRANGEKEYKIPKGGLFGFVICPHYLFEIIGFIGLSFISQTLHALSITTGIIFYLMGRSYATRRWYISKFEALSRLLKIPFLGREGDQHDHGSAAESDFPTPPSFVINGISTIFLILLAILGFLEKTGKMHLQYSKFWNTTTRKSAVTQKIKLPSTIGMLFLYVPAFLAAFISLVIFPLEGIRILLLCSALALHFFKRIFEISFYLSLSKHFKLSQRSEDCALIRHSHVVLFDHKYSGGMILDSVILITFTYFSLTASMIYVQNLTQGFPEPEIDLKYLGFVLFLIGIAGNFYHHIPLAHLRKKGEK
ncbi:hypothetical protein FEM48_Zijuj03G0031000 [Ziziphus jujuba var. spinosa]|uniref:3-oxo-5-alpha-steroid 4-dehydrogenase C-terminal domain-containing protein n=1 Tax=Ziziphus jujuba var. spinosa TaxID=714518 RepID=A0A978VMT5_ZIZJJ|nr:hypothetical protein FEM48_Zijuj03G0031000 [Ziziphus jujuba var. spinosa]